MCFKYDVEVIQIDFRKNIFSYGVLLTLCVPTYFQKSSNFERKKLVFQTKSARFDEVKTSAIARRRISTCSEFNVDYDARVNFEF